jgi:hypothetical protein
VICILSPVTRVAGPYFFKLSNKQHDFLKKVTEDKMCALVSSTTSAGNMSHSKN